MGSIFEKLFGNKPKQKFHGQYLQDRWLYENVFSDKRDGFFVEVGADDGVDKSNTLFFEAMLGWNGICVEPSPRRFESLRENRNCICENYAIAEAEGKVEFMDINGYGKGLSGMVDSYDPRHRDRIEKEIKHPDNKGYELVQVATISLDRLLEKHGVTHVDFCSIDTEGSELRVLRSIDFQRCRFDIILVENNYEDASVQNFLEDAGFELETKVGIDDVYFNKQFIR